MSIRDEVKLDFRVPGTTPEMDRFRAGRKSSGVRLPTVVVFIGPNGSGKTILLRAMISTARFISCSITENSKEQINYFFPPFNSSECRYKPTQVEFEFDLNLMERFKETIPPGLCRYSLEIQRHDSKGNNHGKVSYEAMHIYPKNRPYRIFERSLNKPTYINKNIGIRKSDERILSAPLNASLISTLARFDVEPFKSLSQVVQLIATNIGGSDSWQPSDEDVVKHYCKPNLELTDEISQLLPRMDIGINEVEIDQSNEFPTLVFKHRGMDTPIVFGRESSGTRQLVQLYPSIHFTLDKGSIAIFDNFDSGLHEALATELLQRFQNKEDNPLCAQLFCTSHSSSLLSELEKEEVYIVQKDRRTGSSLVYSVKDIQGVRRTEDLHKLYCGGVLGGIPNIG